MSIQISESVTSHILDDDVLLFSARHQQLFHLNPSAAFIWLCCEDGLEHESICMNMADSFDISVGQAKEDLANMLTAWESRGFVRSADGSAPVQDTYEEPPVLDPPDLIVQQVELMACRLEHCYQLLETVFLVRCNDENTEAVVRTVIGHLEVSTSLKADVTLDVQRDRLGYSLFLDGQLVSQCETEDELAPLIHGKLLTKMYDSSDFLIAIHAAAISNGKECVVLPARSGSGKSTLTAALVRSDYLYCTDEMVLLKQQTHTVQAVAAGIAIKSGSWDVLKDYYPDIGNIPVYERQDYKLVRYLIPSAEMLPENLAAGHDVTSLVFPVYQPDTPTSLNSISTADGLCRLTLAGYDMEGGLDSEKVARLIDWVSGVNCYELHVQNLPDAITAIREILP